MSITTTSPYSIDEGTEPNHTFTILDAAGDAATPDNLTLTYYDRVSGDIINSREDQDVLGANNVTVTNGVVVWSMQEEDTAIIDSDLMAEIHVALWEWDFSGREGKHETIFRVVNLSKVS